MCKFLGNVSFSSFVGFEIDNERVKLNACLYHLLPHTHTALLQLSREML